MKGRPTTSTGFSLRRKKLELFLPEKKGEPNHFTHLEERLKKKGRRLKFAMNSGIYDQEFRPSGLHISAGKTITKLNTEDFVKEHEDQLTPNFFLKPNGVFYLMESGAAGILETERYQQVNLRPKPMIATQSGPLLVEDKEIHHALNKESTSVLYRNGVGVTSDGKVVFACSVISRETGKTNLFHFAEMFRDKLKCPNALYLDGVISDIYIRELMPAVRDRNVYAGILAISEPLPEE